ncbi:hypothetical protein QUC31_009028 [Theobroma cacao]
MQCFFAPFFTSSLVLSEFYCGTAFLDDFRSGFEIGPCCHGLGLLISHENASLMCYSHCLFQINGNATDHGSVSIPIQFQAYSAGKIPCN